ncbi:hypothetical protein GLU01_01250 [Nanohaloarchaea archaeon]|nr:hypothetical protein [Candidatus Nanohaloarchaea archaeon]
MKGIATETVLKLIGMIIFTAVALAAIGAMLSGLDPSSFFNQNLVNAFFKDLGS